MENVKSVFVIPTVSKTGVAEYTNESITVVSNMKFDDATKTTSVRNGDAGKKVSIVAYLPQNLDELFACPSTGSYDKEGKMLSVIKYMDKVQVCDPDSGEMYEIQLTLTGNVHKKDITVLKDKQAHLAFTKAQELRKTMLAEAEQTAQENVELKDTLAKQQAEMEELKKMMAELMASKK